MTYFTDITTGLVGLLVKITEHLHLAHDIWDSWVTEVISMDLGWMGYTLTRGQQRVMLMLESTASSWAYVVRCDGCWIVIVPKSALQSVNPDSRSILSFAINWHKNKQRQSTQHFVLLNENIATMLGFLYLYGCRYVIGWSGHTFSDLFHLFKFTSFWCLIRTTYIAWSSTTHDMTFSVCTFALLPFGHSNAPVDSFFSQRDNVVSIWSDRLYSPAVWHDRIASTLVYWLRSVYHDPLSSKHW